MAPISRRRSTASTSSRTRARGGRCRGRTAALPGRPGSRGASRGAAGPVLTRGDAERHARSDPREGTGARSDHGPARPRCRDGNASRMSGAPHGFAAGCNSGVPAAAFAALSDAILNDQWRAAGSHRRSVLERRRRRRRSAPILPLGAGVSGGVLRQPGSPTAARRVRRRPRQPAVGHDSRRCRQRRRALGRARRHRHRCCGSPGTPASTRRNQPATPIVISCSSSGRCTSPGRAAASGWSFRPAWRPIMAAVPCGNGCSPAAMSTRSSASTTTAASFRFIAACAFFSSPRPLALQPRGSRAASDWTMRRSSSRWATNAADSADWFPVKLSPALLERLSGPGLTIPSLRSAMDLAICRARGLAVSSARQPRWMEHQRSGAS